MTGDAIVRLAALALVLFAVGAVAMSDNPFADEPEPDVCSEHTGVLYLDNDTVRNTSDGGVNITFTICDETGRFNGTIVNKSVESGNLSLDGLESKHD